MDKKKYDWDLFFNEPCRWKVACFSEKEAQDVCRQIEEVFPGIKFVGGTLVSPSNNRFSESGKCIIYAFLCTGRNTDPGNGKILVGRDGEMGDMEDLPLLDEVEEYNSKELENFLSSIM